MIDAITPACGRYAHPRYWRSRLPFFFVFALAALLPHVANGAEVDRSVLAYSREEAYSQGAVGRLTVPFELLTTFLPGRRGDFILPWWTIAEQVSEGLGVAPLDARQLPDGRRLLWGCRRHSCLEKAAVVVSPAGKVEAAALIHFRCHFKALPVRRSDAWRKSNYDCDIDHKTLTVFLHVNQTYRADFERWAEVVSDDLVATEIYWV